MVSIIIPVYNQAKKLDKCLKSIKGQTYDNYEIIVVNDGSIDGINLVLEKYKRIFNTRIKIINQGNKGANPARNRGAAAAQGEYLLFCDADLILKPIILELMLEKLISRPEVSYVYSSFRYGFKTFKLWPFDAQRLKKMPYIHTTSLIRKEHFPGFDETITRLQDWDLWLTMLELGHIGVWLNQVLFKIQTGGTMSNWLPSFFYKFLPFLFQVKKFKEAEGIIKKKHNLE